MNVASDVTTTATVDTNTTVTTQINVTKEQQNGVVVAGWNYDGVKYPLLVTVFIIILVLLQLGEQSGALSIRTFPIPVITAYHHVKFVSHTIPESCLLIVLGLIIGALFSFVFSSIFPKRTFFKTGR
jgi:hypothetical protein